MTRHWTEAAISAALDGTFTRAAADGRIIIDNVEYDYIPVYGNDGKVKGGHRAPYSTWTPEEDGMLVDFRRRNMAFNEIAWLLSRTEESAIARYKILRGKGRV